MAFLDKSTQLRDVEADGSRFWVVDDLATEAEKGPFGDNTVGIADDNEGGIVAYVHADNAPRILEAFRAFTNEI